METYKPETHHRHSVRLKEYDYSQEGLYFITICTQNHKGLFGDVIDGEITLNETSEMIAKWCEEIPHKFHDIIMDTYVIMPNHFHAIIINTGQRINERVGANLRVRPNDTPKETRNILGEHAGSPLHAVVQWFKTMTTNEYIRNVKMRGWQPFDKRIWQRNYYEHIIRNGKSYQNIEEYIINNPANWGTDCLNRDT